MKFSFRRKPEENPYEALERLDAKIKTLIDERRHWLFKLSPHAMIVVNKLETRYRELIILRNSFLEEIRERHKLLSELKPNIVNIETRLKVGGK